MIFKLFFGKTIILFKTNHIIIRQQIGNIVRIHPDIKATYIYLNTVNQINKIEMKAISKTRKKHGKWHIGMGQI